MAIDITNTSILPAFMAVAAADTNCTQIRVPPHHRVRIFADAAIYLFNGVSDGGATPAATLRKELTATQASAGYETIAGGAGPGVGYATICVAAQAGTARIEVEVMGQEL